MVNATLSSREFYLLQKFIQDYCGIQIPESKAYLLHSRLSKLLAEQGLKSYLSLYTMLRRQDNRELAEKVIDAITIKETHWFRDKSPWVILDEVLLPQYINELRQRKRTRVRIWSAACSTGQEPYSTAICIDQHLKRNGIKDVDLDRFEILATDISPSVLDIARKGTYDSISLHRGLNELYRNSYFKQEGRFWTVEQRIKDCVTFQQFNLTKSFLLLGHFDLILCRYVTIYFMNDFARDVLNKMATALNPEGVLLLGNSEIFTEHKKHFLLQNYKGGVYYLKLNSNSEEGAEHEYPYRR